MAEPAFVRDLAPLVHRWGYLVVFGSILGEDFGLPLPGETMLITAAVLAGLGQLNIFWLLPIAWLGAVIGDNIGYGIGFFGGRPLVLRFGRYVFITSRRLAIIEGFFARHGGKVVIVARFIELLRQLNGVVAGLSRMPWPRFLTFNAIGAALWVCFWGLFAYFAGSRLDAIYGVIRRYEIWFVLLVALIAIAFVAYRLNRRRFPPP
jgi:membrane protein DedA with SNARE-associated domain